ncbi:MAG: glycosyltransferase family 4 protein [Candidatus Aminicenantes bacterium]|nr:glycosyltransferase family 4 protein [Candidatus Aminicenantes bacterium]
MNRVLFVSHTAELKGAERFLLDILRTLDRSRFAPRLVVPRSGPLEEKAAAADIAVSVVPFKWWLTEPSRMWKQPLANLWNRPAVSTVARLIKTNGMDLVFSNSAAVAVGALAARRARVPHVWFIHEVLDGARPMLRSLFGYRHLVRMICRRSRRVVVNSLASARAFAGCAAVDVVYNGLPDGAGRVEPRAELRPELGLDDEARAVGVVGTIFPGKGQREAVLALASLAARFPRLKLLLIGEAADVGYVRQIEKTIARHGLGGRVVFTGFRSDLDEVLGLLDLLLIPSTVDSFGRVALEAMAAEVPVVAVARGGLPEVVEHGETGFLVDGPEPDTLAAGMAAVLDSPVRAREVAARARRAVRRRFSLTAEVRKLERILEGCLER